MALGLSVVPDGALGIAVGVCPSDRAVPLRLWRSALIVVIGFWCVATAALIALPTTGKLSFQHLSLFAAATAPLIIGRAAGRYGLFNSLHFPIVPPIASGIGNFKHLTSAI